MFTCTYITKEPREICDFLIHIIHVYIQSDLLNVDLLHVEYSTFNKSPCIEIDYIMQAYYFILSMNFSNIVQ